MKHPAFTKLHTLSTNGHTPVTNGVLSTVYLMPSPDRAAKKDKTTHRMTCRILKEFHLGRKESLDTHDYLIRKMPWLFLSVSRTM